MVIRTPGAVRQSSTARGTASGTRWMPCQRLRGGQHVLREAVASRSPRGSRRHQLIARCAFSRTLPMRRRSRRCSRSAATGTSPTHDHVGAGQPVLGQVLERRRRLRVAVARAGRGGRPPDRHRTCREDRGSQPSQAASRQSARRGRGRSPLDVRADQRARAHGTYIPSRQPQQASAGVAEAVVPSAAVPCSSGDESGACTTSVTSMSPSPYARAPAIASCSWSTARAAARGPVRRVGGCGRWSGPAVAMLSVGASARSGPATCERTAGVRLHR